MRLNPVYPYTKAFYNSIKLPPFPSLQFSSLITTPRAVSFLFFLFFAPPCRPHLIYVLSRWTQFTFSKRCPPPPSENLAREFDKFASVTRLVYAIRGRHGCVLLFGKPVSRRLIGGKKERRVFAEAENPTQALLRS